MLMYCMNMKCDRHITSIWVTYSLVRQMLWSLLMKTVVMRKGRHEQLVKWANGLLAEADARTYDGTERRDIDNMECEQHRDSDNDNVPLKSSTGCKAQLQLQEQQPGRWGKHDLYEHPRVFFNGRSVSQHSSDTCQCV